MSRDRVLFVSVLLAAVVIAAVLALVLGGGGEEGGEAGPAVSTGCEAAEEPPPKDETFEGPEPVLERGEPARAVVTTSCGTFEIRLDTQGSPKTANSFAFLAEQGLYDGTIVHRIAPGYVVQAGDPTGEGNGDPGYTVTEPPPPDAEYLRGTVAMGRTAIEPPGTSGSQFFIVTAPADAGLPPDYAILGEVTKGMDVVERIDGLGDPETERPLDTVLLESVAIEAG